MQLCLSLPELVRLQLRECQIETVSGLYHHDDDDFDDERGHDSDHDDVIMYVDHDQTFIALLTPIML